MIYDQAVQFLFNQLPVFQRDGKKAYKIDLSRTLELCSFFGNPQHKFKSIHVAGTNGKGSTSHLIAAPLQTARYKVGIYTSPHYKDFRERIKINGILMEEDFVVDFVCRVMPILEEIKPSFFELTVVMAFEYFAYCKVDVAVIEVGLGGRLDSTNIITPLLSVITNIGMDHEQFLGNTLTSIATEKAGIIKPTIPVVIGEKHPETTPVFIGISKLKDAPISFAEEVYNFEITFQDHFHFQGNIYKNKELILENISIKVSGAFQAKNIVTAIAALQEIIKINSFPLFNKEHIRTAWADLADLTYYIGRWHVLNEKPLTIADSAHNAHGLHYNCKFLNDFNNNLEGKLHIVLGFVNDKKLDTVVELFPKEATYYFCKANIHRALDEKVLQSEFLKFNRIGEAYETVEQAYKTAQKQADASDLIFIGGSIFVVSEVL